MPCYDYVRVYTCVRCIVWCYCLSYVFLYTIFYKPICDFFQIAPTNPLVPLFKKVLNNLPILYSGEIPLRPFFFFSHLHPSSRCQPEPPSAAWTCRSLPLDALQVPATCKFAKYCLLVLEMHLYYLSFMVLLVFGCCLFILFSVKCNQLSCPTLFLNSISFSVLIVSIFMLCFFSKVLYFVL